MPQDLNIRLHGCENNKYRNVISCKAINRAKTELEFGNETWILRKLCMKDTNCTNEILEVTVVIQFRRHIMKQTNKRKQQTTNIIRDRD
jgi:hypothetical protein